MASTHPTFSGWYTYNSSNNNLNADACYCVECGHSLNVFDHNQGEAAHPHPHQSEPAGLVKAVS